jgi:protein CpxP
MIDARTPMQRKPWHHGIWAAGLALQLCAAPALAQSTPATTPSTPPVTTPPPPAVHPPMGGPDTLPPREPANAIASGEKGTEGLSKGANSFTETQARSRMEQHGYRQISALTKDADGIWRGSATRNGRQVHVGLDYKGNVSSN